MSEDMITPVLRYALELCNARERGGRGIATNEFSGSILDCSCWHDEYTEAILSRSEVCLRVVCVDMRDPLMDGTLVLHTNANTNANSVAFGEADTRSAA